MVKLYLFSSSSPSVRRSGHCFGVPSRVAGTASLSHIRNFQGSNVAGSPRLRVFINHLTLPVCTEESFLLHVSSVTRHGFILSYIYYIGVGEDGIKEERGIFLHKKTIYFLLKVLLNFYQNLPIFNKKGSMSWSIIRWKWIICFLF